MEKIDSLDRQILEIISQNARIPFKDVAAECGVSRAAIHQRVQRLIDLGVIIGSGIFFYSFTTALYIEPFSSLIPTYVHVLYPKLLGFT